MGLFHSDLLRMVTFIFCIYGASLGFMYLIYLSFSGWEFIATPMACVKLGQTYLNRICTLVKRSPLHIEESSSNPEMQGGCLLHCLLYSAQQDVHKLWNRALERVQAGMGNVSGETSGHGPEERAAERSVSAWTPEAAAHFRKTKLIISNQPNHTSNHSYELLLSTIDSHSSFL